MLAVASLDQMLVENVPRMLDATPLARRSSTTIRGERVKNGHILVKNSSPSLHNDQPRLYFGTFSMTVSVMSMNYA